MHQGPDITDHPFLAPWAHTDTKKVGTAMSWCQPSKGTAAPKMAPPKRNASLKGSNGTKRWVT